MPNGQVLQVGLSFTADTSKARAELDKLKNDLSKTTTTFGIGKNLDKDLKSAIDTAMKLQGVLQKATDASGNFNLSKFERSLRQSNLTIGQVQQSLDKIGLSDSFNRLASQINTASTRANVLQGTLKKFYDGLKNTAMWNIQSQAIHGFQSALQGAFSYAQELNKGLTDIAIVSDLSGEKLAQFAKTANQMARDLSANTKDVVSGALIYYQAGLSDEEVIKRTETTIKLAQTSGESAEQISSYMTAIWNNFYDGSKSVEYYADAISYLGAVTAASNADIAEGLQSFAATAETVGLSFEYAASAVTTIRDVTQQSASTIGNSLKTIFARLSSLKMGETLEDGVDLTKYSKALDAVGVSVLDTNGELRNMDDILDDLAIRWDYLTKAQKDALAQTVGGVRQYNSLITLLDNYEKFQDLVSGAEGSDGYLTHQADIYAESWEGAKNRLTAAWQKIYDQLIDEKFWTKLTDFLANIVNFVSEIIEGLGGLPGLLSVITLSISSMRGFGDDLRTTASAILEIKDALNGIQKTRNEDIQVKALESMVRGDAAKQDEYADILNNIEERSNLLKKGQIEKAGELTAIILRQKEIVDQINADEAERIRLETEKIKLLEKQKQLEEKQKYEKLSGTIDTLKGLDKDKDQKKYIGQIAKDPEKFGLSPNGASAKRITDAVVNWTEDSVKTILRSLSGTLSTYGKNIKDAELEAQIAETENASETAKQNNEDIKNIKKEIVSEEKKTTEGTNDTNKALEQTNKELDAVNKKYDEIGEKIENQKNELKEPKYGANSDPNKKDEKGLGDYAQAAIRAASAISSINYAIDGFNKAIGEFKEGNIDLGTLLTRLTSGAMSAMYAFKMLTGALELFGMAASTATIVGGVLVGVLLVIKGLSYLFHKETEDLKKLTEENKKLADERKKLTTETDNLATSVGELVEKYKELSEEGGNTFDVLNDLKEQVPELIDKYEELKETLGTDWDLDGLKKAYELGADTGDWDKFNELNEKIQKDIVSENAKTARADRINAQNNMATSGTGTVQNGKYQTTLWGSEEDYKIGREKLEGFLQGSSGNTVNFDPSKIKEYYEALVDTADALKEAERENGSYYQNIQKEIAALQPAYQELVATQKESLTAFTADFDQAFADVNLSMSDLVDPSNRQDLLDKIQNVYGVTPDEAEAILRSSEVLGSQERLYQRWLDQFTELDTEGNVDEAKTQATIDKVAGWYDQLDEYLRPYAPTIQFDPNNINQDEFKEKVKEAWNAAQLEENIKESIEHGFEEADVREYIDYIKEHFDELDFSEYLENDEAAIAEIVDDIMRFDRACESAAEHMDEWESVLENGVSQDKVKAVKELREAYSDMLDLDFDTLSDDFLENTDNLDLMKSALEGNEEAYQRLQELANEDIILHLDYGELSTEELNNFLSEVQNVKSMLQDEFHFDDMAVGDSLNTQPFLDALTAMVNAAHMTRDEALAYLQDMNIDAEVEEVKDEATDTDTYTKAIPQVSPYPLTAQLPAGFTTGGSGWVDQITGWNFDPVTSEKKKETTAVALKVTKANKGAGGNVKFNQSTHGAGKKGASAPKKGGGGGHKEQKTKEKDTNRYHEVTDQLKRNKNALEILNQSKDRAFGQGRVDYMKQEIELLQQQAELYQKLAKEAEDYYNKDRNVLVGYGAQFNEDGSIKNFQNWYDSFIDKYNAGGMDDDAWKKFEDAIKKYEQSLDKLHEAEKGYNDAMNKIYDERLEIVTYKVKYLNELIEEGTKYLDYLIKQADKSIYEIGEKVGLLGQKAANAMQEVANIQNGIIEMLSNENHPELTSDIVEKYLNGSYSLEDLLANIGQLTEKERQQLLDYREQLLKWAETLDELRTEAYEQLSDSIDQFNDKIDHQKDIIEDLANVMKNYRDIVDIVGKDVLGVSNELLQQMNRVTLQSAEKNLIISRKQFDVIKDNYAKLRAEYESMLSNPEIGEADKKLMEKELADVYDQMLAAQNEYLDREKEALQKAVDNFKDNMQMIADTFDKAVSGTAGSLANLQEYFDLQKKVDDQYLPTYEQIYNLSKLTRDVNNAINNTDNIKGKERLKKLQQDILQAEREGKKLNEYDIGLLQRRLELEQALIAMEEARDAKNMVRMTRDNEGNWSYTYTQNPEDAEKARQDYEDKLYNLEKWNQDQVNAMQSAYLQQLQDYTNYINGLDITDEERNKRIGEKQRQLQEIYGDFLNQALQDGQWITNEYGVQNHNLIDSFNETTLAIEGNFDSLNEMLDNFRINSLMADQEITASFQEWYENRERILNEAGQDLDNFTDILTGDMEEASQAMDDAADAAEEMSDNMGKEFQEILDNLKKMFYGEDGMSKTIDDIINKFKGWQQKILDVIKSIGELNNTKVNISVPNPSSGGGGGGGSGGGGGDSGSSGGNEGGGGGGCSGCTGTCSGGCSTGCSGGCRTGCKGCNNTCSGTCKNTSSQTGCAASCTGTCKTGCLATSKGGCFDPGTKILMGDGTEKNIEEIQYGDIIMTYNEETKEFIPEELFTMTRHHNTINMLYVELEDGTVLGITACHPILTTDGWKSLDYETALLEHNIETSPLEIGQEVLGYNKTSKIKNIIWRKNLQDYVTYNITLNNTHTFIANGYIAHNANQAATLMKNADGGLMGSWGPEGKFAMMHEKELVLNKEDTVNMLHTVGFVRDLVEMLTTNAGISASGLGNLLAGGVSSSSNYLDQNVTIHAEFPNATNHSEIEEAFNNLIGLAGQYAGRKQ